MPWLVAWTVRDGVETVQWWPNIEGAVLALLVVGGVQVFHRAHRSVIDFVPDDPFAASSEPIDAAERCGLAVRPLRVQYPQYNNLSDRDLATRLFRKVPDVCFALFTHPAGRPHS